MKPVVLAASALLFVQGLQQPPTFRTGVDAVTIDVSVLDAQRHPIVGLTKEDLTILEDGGERPIVAFAAVDAAGSKTRVTELPPPLRGAQARAETASPGRIVGITTERRRRARSREPSSISSSRLTSAW